MSELVGQRSLPAVTNEAPLSWPVFLGCSTCPPRHSSGQGDRNPTERCCVANVWKRIRPKSTGIRPPPFGIWSVWHSCGLPASALVSAPWFLPKAEGLEVLVGASPSSSKAQVQVRRGLSEGKVSTINPPPHTHTRSTSLSAPRGISGVRNREVSSPAPSPLLCLLLLLILLCVLFKTTC